MESMFIKFNDKNKVTVNISDITLFFNQKINGSNGYYCIDFLFKNGKSLSLRYEQKNEDKYNEDVKYLNSLTSRR